MKTKLLLSLSLAAITLVGCNNALNDQNEPSKDELLMGRIKASVSSSNSKTTLTDNDVKFAAGDKLGLFEVTNNGTSARLWTATDNNSVIEWNTADKMYWKDKTSNHTFFAYSPCDVAATDHTAVAMPALSAQVGDAASLTAYDFLYSVEKTATYGTNGSIDLAFKHANALLQLDIKASAATNNATYPSFTLTSDGIANTSTITLVDGVSTISATNVPTITVTPATAATLSTTSTTYYAVINDKTKDVIKFSINFTIDNNTYTASGELTNTDTDPADPQDKSFEKGKKYKYTITVDRNKIVIVSATITPWTSVDGGDVAAN